MKNLDALKMYVMRTFLSVSLGIAAIAAVHADQDILFGVELKDLNIASISPTGATFAVQLDVTNFSDQAFEIESLEYELDVNDSEITDGKIDVNAEFPSQGVKSVSMEVPVEYGKNLVLLTSAMNNVEESEYKIEGKLFLAGRSKPVEFNYSQSFAEALGTSSL